MQTWTYIHLHLYNICIDEHNIHTEIQQHVKLLAANVAPAHMDTYM